jgi:uncharacterized protein (TIGR03435 family)
MCKLAAIVLFPFVLFGQRFETATVALSDAGSTGSRLVDDATRFEFHYASLRSLLALAYGVNTWNVRGPAWIDREVVDVIARKPLHTTDDGERLMLQSLLAEYFQLATHRDRYDLSVYDLVIAKSGIRAKRVEAASPQSGTMKGPARSLKGTLSMEALTAALQIPLETSVRDATGLSGTFEVELKWSPEDAIAAELPGATFPPLEKALEQQLGLALQKRTIMVDSLIVDKGRALLSGN